MKKFSLLNFPEALCEPHRKSDSMKEMFEHNKKQRSLKSANRLNELKAEIARLLQVLEAVPEAGLQYNKFAHFRFVERLKEEEERVHRYKNELDEKSEMNRKRSDYYSIPEMDRVRKQYEEQVKRHQLVLAEKPAGFDDYHFMPDQWHRDVGSLRHYKTELKEVEALLERQLPYIPMPLKPAHIQLMNAEMEQMERQGFTMEHYELLVTEFHTGNHIQQCYSGVLFTWKKVGQPQPAKQIRKQPR